MKAKTTELELDVLRGVAVAFMLINHAGVRWLDTAQATDSLALWLVELGSHAPVLFFSITGVGYALGGGHRSTPKPTVDVLYKAGLLLIADGFMRGGDFSYIGWDFLAFIGFAAIAVQLIRRASRRELDTRWPCRGSPARFARDAWTCWRPPVLGARARRTSDA
jgi:hypothetical protein